MVADVELKLIPSDPTLNSSQSKTNKKGKYLFGVIRPAKYRILANKEGMRVSRIDINLATPEDKSVWAFHEDMTYGAEVPEFTITGLTAATYDLKVAPSTSGPGKWGTGDPLSSVDAIVKTIEAGKAAEAEREIRRHLEQDPKSATFNYLHAFALNAQGSYDDALAAVDRSLASEPPFEGANLLRGKILEAKKDVPGALAAYRRETEVATRAPR